MKEAVGDRVDREVHTGSVVIFWCTLPYRVGFTTWVEVPEHKPGQSRWILGCWGGLYQRPHVRHIFSLQGMERRMHLQYGLHSIHWRLDAESGVRRVLAAAAAADGGC